MYPVCQLDCRVAVFRCPQDLLIMASILKLKPSSVETKTRRETCVNRIPSWTPPASNVCLKTTITQQHMSRRSGIALEYTHREFQICVISKGMCQLRYLPNSRFSKYLSKNLKIKIYRTIMMSVVLYGCETWSLTLREERKLGCFRT